MPRTTIFIASRTEQENYILHKKVEGLEQEFRDLSFVGVHPLGLQSSVDALTGAVVYNFNEWTAKEGAHLLELRKSGYKGPVLVIAKAEVTEALGELKASSGVVFLEKPYETKDLTGILRKMLLARAVAQRIFRRFDCAQDAEVNMHGNVDPIVSRVRNLSKGGAYVEFMTQAPIKVGEFLSLKMVLKDMNRTYTIPAKVVWTARGNSRGTGGIGVEFTGPGDVKRLILGA